MKYINKKKLIIAIVIAAAVVAAMISNYSFMDMLAASENVRLSFQTGIDYSTAVCDKNILFVNNEGIRSINKNGKEDWRIDSASTLPRVEVEGAKIMTADINGKNVNVYKDEKSILRFKTERDILSAKMNKNGYIAVAGSELGYKGLITVYDNNGREYFKWHSGSGYISDMDISGKNELIVSQVMTDRESVYSKLVLINMKKENNVSVIAEVEGIGLRTVFRDNGNIIVLTDNGLYGFKKSGGQKFHADFKGRTPIGYNIDNDNNMVIAFNDSINNTILEIYASGGKKRGIYEAREEIKSFDVNGECIVAAKQRELVRIAPSGTVKASFDISHDVKSVKIFPGRGKAVVIGGNSAEIIKIR